MSREWKDAQTEMAKEQKMDPYVAYSCPDYVLQHWLIRLLASFLALSLSLSPIILAFTIRTKTNSFTGPSRADGKGKVF
jgi:hypothetical protein